jgi:hypothetical protein
MLTDDYIFKVSALDEQTGEPPPGYLHDGDSGLDGQAAASEAPALPQFGKKPKQTVQGSKTYRLILERVVDPATGELRLSQK